MWYEISYFHSECVLNIKLNSHVSNIRDRELCMNEGDIALFHSFVINSRCSTEFRVNSCESRDRTLRDLSGRFLFRFFAYFFFFLSSLDAGYAKRARIRTRIELDAALLNTQCDLFETRRIKHKGPCMIGKLLRRTRFVGQSRSALK